MSASDYLTPELYDLVYRGFDFDIAPLVASALVEGAVGERFFRELPLPDGSGRLRMFDRIAPEDRVEQIRHVTRRLEFLDPAGAVRETREGRFTIRYVFKPEMELLLRVAGFARWEVEPLGRPATDDAGRALREGDTLRWTAWND